jgi:MFS family permease
MASFDFIEATSKGYEFSWHERSYLMRAAMPVIFVKLVCVLAIHFLQIEDKSLLSGLVFMPAHIVEALFMISVVRYVAFREPLFEFGRVVGTRNQPDTVLDENAKEAEIQKAQGAFAFSREKMFKAGVAVYLLIKIVLLGFFGMITDYGKTLDPSIPVPTPEPSIVVMFIIMAMLGAMLWMLRLLWLYIPVALGYSVHGFLVRVKGMMSSLNIFATMFVCNFTLGALIVGALALSNFVVTPETALQVFVYDVITIIGMTIIDIVQAVALTFGFIAVLTQQQHKINKRTKK